MAECATCKYFSYSDGNGLGLCYRFPPTWGKNSAGKAKWTLPETYARSFCGEYEPCDESNDEVSK